MLINFSLVCVQLNQPLWLKRPSPHELAMQMAAFCVQLDSLVVSSSFQVCVQIEHIKLYMHKLSTFTDTCVHVYNVFYVV